MNNLWRGFLWFMIQYLIFSSVYCEEQSRNLRGWVYSGIKNTCKPALFQVGFQSFQNQTFYPNGRSHLQDVAVSISAKAQSSRPRLPLPTPPLQRPRLGNPVSPGGETCPCDFIFFPKSQDVLKRLRTSARTLSVLTTLHWSRLHCAKLHQTSPSDCSFQPRNCKHGNTQTMTCSLCFEHRHLDSCLCRHKSITGRKSELCKFRSQTCSSASRYLWLCLGLRFRKVYPSIEASFRDSWIPLIAINKFPSEEIRSVVKRGVDIILVNSVTWRKPNILQPYWLWTLETPAAARISTLRCPKVQGHDQCLNNKIHN